MPDCTGMVMEENPSKLIMNFLHFLRSIGLGKLIIVCLFSLSVLQYSKNNDNSTDKII